VPAAGHQRLSPAHQPDMTDKEISKLTNYYQSTDPRDWEIDTRKATEFAEGMLHHNAGMAWYFALFLYAHGQDDAMHLVGKHIDHKASVPSGVINGFKTLGIEGEDAVRELVIPLPF
jgi:hypothetical protein